MTVFRRLFKIAKPYRGTMYTGLFCTAISSFLETTIISLLFAAMISVVIQKQVVSLTTSLESPQPANTPITLTAAATGTANKLYQFWAYQQGVTPAWRQLQAPSTHATCVWQPTMAGSYLLVITARDGATGKEVNTTVGYAITSGTPPAVVSPGASHPRGLLGQIVGNLTLRVTHLVEKLKLFFDRFVEHFGPTGALIVLAIIMLLVVLIKCLADAGMGYLMNRFSNQVALVLRQQLFTHLLRLSPAYFKQESTGAHVSRITGDVVALQQCLGTQLSEIISAPLSIAFALGGMFFLNWQLTLTALCLAPLIAVVMSAGGRQIRKLSTRIQERIADLNAGLVERLSLVHIIQSYVREPYEIERVGELNRHYFRDIMRSLMLTETISPGVEFVAYIGMVCGIIMAGYQVAHGNMTHTYFFAFIMMAQRGGSHFKRLSRINQVRQQALGAGLRIFDLLDIEPEIKDAPGARPLPAAEGRIIFDRVDFHYTRVIAC